MLMAAGSGRRMNLNINKVYLTLRAQQIPALYYPLAACEKHPYIDEIVVVVRREDTEELQKLIIHEKFPHKPVWVALGGENRYDSVRNGLQKVTGDIVLVHDGARPLLRRRFITECVEAMDEHPGATLGVRNIDRICYNADGFVAENRPEGVLCRVQTPQCFSTALLRECHEAVADKTGVADDSTLLELCGHRVKIIEGDETNMKITVPTDVIIAEHYISHDEEILGLLQ